MSVLADPAPSPALPQSATASGASPATATPIHAPGASATEAPLTGAELKKQKQAEKQAKRAAEKAARGAQTVQGKPKVPEPTLTDGHTKAAKTEGAKAAWVPHTINCNGEKKIPVREKMEPAEPKKEDKTVELFRHLEKPRRSTIAGVSVHPAILSLGLQMSSYTICGSTARLVATLQAFKRVGQEKPLHFERETDNSR